MTICYQNAYQCKSYIYIGTLSRPWPLAYLNITYRRCKLLQYSAYRILGAKTFHWYHDVTLKQQNRYLWVIIVCGYFSVIRSFTWPNYPSESNSYHKTSLSVSFGCRNLSGIPLSPLHFTVYTIAWQRKFEPQWVLNTILCIFSGRKVKYQPFSLCVY